MKPIIVAAVLAASGGQATALSCNFGNTAAAWVEAEQTNTPFMIVQGQFYLADAWPQFQEEDYALPARFEGVILAANGTTRSLRTKVEVIGACINGDCGYLSPDVEVITFLHDVGGILSTYSIPCSSFPLAPREDVVQDLLSCMNEGPCIPEFQF